MLVNGVNGALIKLTCVTAEATDSLERISEAWQGLRRRWRISRITRAYRMVKRLKSRAHDHK